MSDNAQTPHFGDPAPPLPAAASLGVGVNALAILSVLPIVLGALAAEGRLTGAEIGQTATVEMLAIGGSTAAAGIVLKAKRLRLLGFTLALALAALDAVTGLTHGLGVMAARAGAGVVEGALLWIMVSMIARTKTPPRWSGLYTIAQVLFALVVSITLSDIVPLAGARGAFFALAGFSAAASLAALLAPDSFMPLPTPEGEGGLPPLRGWAALLATMIFAAGAGAVGVYLLPLAAQAGLSPDVARQAVSYSLASQLCAGIAATALAARLGYVTIYGFVTAVSLGAWWIFGHHVDPVVFIAANVGWGFSAAFLAPFILPVLIDADPARRAAVLGGASQLIGGAMGPFASSLVVHGGVVRPVLWLGAAFLLTGLSGVVLMRVTRPRSAGMA